MPFYPAESTNLVLILRFRGRWVTHVVHSWSLESQNNLRYLRARTKCTAGGAGCVTINRIYENAAENAVGVAALCNVNLKLKADFYQRQECNKKRSMWTESQPWQVHQHDECTFFPFLRWWVSKTCSACADLWPTQTEESIHDQI